MGLYLLKMRNYRRRLLTAEQMFLCTLFVRIVFYKWFTTLEHSFSVEKVW